MALSRLGVYIRVPGVDVAKFEQSMQGGGLLGYIDALSGGSISKVGVFSLGESASILVHGLSGCICEHMVDHMLARWTTVGLSCSDHLEASVDDSCHILLAVLAEFALNMRVLLQSWLFVLQYAKTASCHGLCCPTLPCMFAFSHGCIGLNMQILLSVWFVLLHVTVQVMLLSCLVLLAHAGVAHTLMMQPLLTAFALQLQYSFLPAIQNFAACRNRALHQRLHHSAAASHQLPLP